MKIIKVKYSRLESDNNYNNQEIGLEAEVQNGESYHEVLDFLKKEVHNKLAEESVNKEISELTKEKESLKLQVEQLREEKHNFNKFIWNNRDFLRAIDNVQNIVKNNVELKNDEEIPF